MTSRTSHADRPRRRRRTAAASGCLAALFAVLHLEPASAQGGAPASPESRSGTAAADAQSLYGGWRADALLGQSVTAEGKEIGSVRDIIVDRDGRIAAILIQGGGPVGVPDFVFRVPWSEVDPTPGRPGIAISFADAKRPQYGLFPGSEGVATLPREFRVTEVLGDYVRLQQGSGFGYVTGAVFTDDGRLAAVLAARDAVSGGGTFAFPFVGASPAWDPGASYFGLPFVTMDQAEQAGLRVNPNLFKGGRF